MVFGAETFGTETFGEERKTSWISERIQKMNKVMKLENNEMVICYW